MSLSDRLQRARTRQLIESGVLPSDYALEPEPEVVVAPVEVVDDDAEHGLFAPIKIEVQPTGLHLVPEPPADFTDMPETDRTSNCPNCNTPGHVDMVDLVGHTVHLTCGTCGTMWQVRRKVDQSAAATDPSLQILLRHHFETSRARAPPRSPLHPAPTRGERPVVDLVAPARR